MKTISEYKRRLVFALLFCIGLGRTTSGLSGGGSAFLFLFVIPPLKTLLHLAMSVAD